MEVYNVTQAIKLKWLKIILSDTNFNSNLQLPWETYRTGIDVLEVNLLGKWNHPQCIYYQKHRNTFGAIYFLSSDGARGEVEYFDWTFWKNIEN